MAFAYASIRKEVEQLKAVYNPPPLPPLSFPLKPTQTLIYESLVAPEVRFVSACCGRRYGKSFLAIRAALHFARKYPGAVVWIVSPTFKMAKRNVWKPLKYKVPKAWQLKRPNESELFVELKNGSVIQLQSGEDPEALRGASPSPLFVVLDEFATMKADVWPIVRAGIANLAPYSKVLFIGTPKGYNHFYDIHTEAENRQGWCAFSFNTLQGGYVPQEEIEAARLDMDVESFNQEFLASFILLSGRVYKCFNRHENLFEGVNIMANTTELVIGMDFNVTPMTAVLGLIVGGQLHIIDEFVLKDARTDDMAQAIIDRYGEPATDDGPLSWLSTPSHERRFKMTVYPDPAGKARHTSSRNTDHKILRDYGFKVVAPKAAPPVRDRVNAVNSLLCNAAGARDLLIHPRCKALRKALEGLTYKDGTNDVDKSGGHDHITDALGYLVWSSPVNRYKQRMRQFELGTGHEVAA
ncbi:MAG: hypothetical protein GC179_30725 [Anaerolineaceae bacterium]|nr:hypothetical protein [Anaerolineaceae bacterium]